MANTRRYARNHVWANLDGERVVIGLSTRAVDQLGEISEFALRVAPGDELAQGQCFAVLESAKAEVELFTPISGLVVSVHEGLDLSPGTINDDCYGEGWMIAVTPPDLGEYSALLDAEAYSELLKTGGACE